MRFPHAAGTFDEPHVTHLTHVGRVVLSHAQQVLLQQVFVALDQRALGHVADGGQRVVGYTGAALGLLQYAVEGAVLAHHVTVHVLGSGLTPAAKGYIILEHVADMVKGSSAHHAALVALPQAPLCGLADGVPQLAAQLSMLLLELVHDPLGLSLDVGNVALDAGHARQSRVVALAVLVKQLLHVWNAAVAGDLVGLFIGITHGKHLVALQAMLADEVRVQFLLLHAALHDAVGDLHHRFIHLVDEALALVHVDGTQTVLIHPRVFPRRQLDAEVALNNLLQFLHAQDSILERLLEVVPRQSRLHLTSAHIERPPRHVHRLVVRINSPVPTQTKPDIRILTREVPVVLRGRLDLRGVKYHIFLCPYVPEVGAITNDSIKAVLLEDFLQCRCREIP